MRTDMIADVSNDMTEPMRAFEARTDPIALTRYAAAVERTIEGDFAGKARPNLWRPNTPAIFDRNSRIYMKVWDGVVLSGCHVDLDTEGTFWIKGLFKASYVDRVIPREVVAFAILDIARHFGSQSVFKADIRLMPEGWRDQKGRLRKENTASRRLFSEFGFVDHGEPNSCRYVGDHHDIHLLPSLEPDGQTYRNQTLRSTELSIDLARAYLNSLR